MVQDIGSLKNDFSPTDLLVEDIREGLRVFVESKVCHVCQSTNVAAHCMPKLALSSNFNSLLV